MKIPEESRRTLFFKLPVLNAFLKKRLFAKAFPGTPTYAEPNVWLIRYTLKPQ